MYIQTSKSAHHSLRSNPTHPVTVLVSAHLIHATVHDEAGRRSQLESTKEKPSAPPDFQTDAHQKQNSITNSPCLNKSFFVIIPHNCPFCVTSTYLNPIFLNSSIVNSIENRGVTVMGVWSIHGRKSSPWGSCGEGAASSENVTAVVGVT